MASKNSIFISGWEYNRLLADDPLAPRQSALPGAVLWDGGFQFWMFENAYCTKDSLDIELQASELVGYGQGEIFRDLQQRGFLKAFDWEELRTGNDSTLQELVREHQALRQSYNRNTVIQLLEAGKGEALQGIKLQLLGPILKKLNCVGDVTANSIAYWMRSQGSHQNDAVTQAIKAIVQPLIDNQWATRGITLCHRPGSRATMEQLLDQKRVEEEIQKPLIPSLMAGELSYQTYYEAQLPHKHVYQPISQQLLEDWNNSRERLERIRDWARKNLWKDLHEEWLPRLDDDPSFLPIFQGLVRDAISRAKHEWLDTTVRAAITTVSLGAAGVVGVAVGASLGGIPGTTAGAAVGAVTKQVLEDIHKKRLERTNSLTLFYQSAKTMAN